MIYVLIGVLIGSLIMFLVLNPKRIKIVNSNHETEIQNIKAQEQLHYTELDMQRTLNEIENNKVIIKELQKEIDENNSKLAENSKNISLRIEQANKELQEYCETQKLLKKKEVDETLEKWQQEVLDIRKEYVSEYTTNFKELKEKFNYEKSRLVELTAAVNAAIEAQKRAEEIKSKTDFYRLQLSNEDVEEIKKLRTVEPFLRDPAPLNKVIYKYYYENQYTALVGRIIGKGKVKTGIYKITNIDNQMCYIGQAKNIAERWREHIKKGVGADTPNKNKLYPALKAIGVENFTFEILEECEPERLDEQEKFWTDFYKAQEYGYVVRKG